ncbi:MAG: DUF4396 domain-containing protein [Alphaproteobacteria bacterium]|jgi:hypothetical protein|nr:DUF4396 domain-containing protein [Alphaproteobacteria bacterium]
MGDAIRSVLAEPAILAVWAVVVAFSFAVVLRDLNTANRGMHGLMKYVWGLTVLYSGPVGLAIYFYSGRRQIPHDSLWRRSFRSVSHCYSGCGAGEIAGVFIAAGLLSLDSWWVAGISFALAYVAGFALTMGPLMQEGVPAGQAFSDAFYSETASITVMEVVAIGVDLWLGGGATIDQALFWSALAVSLTCGLAAAYPVNVLLILLGVKEGMHSPKEAHHGAC